MKKIIAITLALVMVLSLGACGKKPASDEYWTTDGNTWWGSDGNAYWTTDGNSFWLIDYATDGDAGWTTDGDAFDDGIPTEPIATEEPEVSPAEPAEAPADEELKTLLLSIRDEYAPGTAGSSLTAARLAAQIMDWYRAADEATDPQVTGYTAQAIVYETALAMGDPGEDVAGMAYADKLDGIYAAAAVLDGETGKGMLADAGYEAQYMPYSMGDVRAVFESVILGMDLTAGGYMEGYIRVYRADETAEHFVPVARPVGMLNPVDIVDALIDLEMLTPDCDMQSFEVDGDTLNIDMNQGFQKFASSMGTTGEYMTVGALVNSFLSTYGAESVNLTVDGAPLETGHNIYDYPVEYFADNVPIP